MAASGETFSESWHRIAERRIALRAGVRAHRQFFRGERWQVLFEPFSNQYFRVRAGAWDFLARLREDKTVQQCWEESLAQHPSDTPGQEEIVQLFAQLYHANLIRSDLPPDAARHFERYQKRQQREMRSRLLSLLFIRIPLCDPDAFLRRTLPLVRWLFSWVGIVLWLGVVGWGIKTGLENSTQLWEQSQSILAPNNIGWLYLALVLLKLMHEMGHAYSCRYLGGEVHVLGVMILIFSPLPFVDATSAWSFRERWKRIFVDAAGMIVELFLAALAMFVWAATAPGAIHAVAYNMIFTASVSTVLANLNPLLRFDGYYILCDLIDLPNLSQRSIRLWRHWIEKFLFGNRQSTSLAETNREATWLGIYGAASFVYRLFLFTGILLYVAGQWLLLGAIMAIMGVITWVVIPLGRLVHYLSSDSQLERVRRRATLRTLGIGAAVIALLAMVPVPDTFTAPGVVQGENYAVVFTASEGYFAEMPTPSGTNVKRGDLLLRSVNHELSLEMEQARAEEQETLALERSALNAPDEGVTAVRERLGAVRSHLRELERQQRDLELRAPQDGTWIAPSLADLQNRWLPRGAAVGEMVDPHASYFSAVVRQEDAAYLFGKDLRAAGVRLQGDSGEIVRVTGATMIPAQQEKLPSAALGWLGGGEIAVSHDDKSGMKSAEAFFELRAALDPHVAAQLWHGRSGKLRCDLPWRPLLPQWYRRVRQLMQKRFQV
jgi:putative peptide zinc metalloprotease protein